MQVQAASSVLTLLHNRAATTLYYSKVKIEQKESMSNADALVNIHEKKFSPYLLLNSPLTLSKDIINLLQDLLI
jgi:hypothetical protein